MLRRCVSLLVIAGFLSSQLASIPHAHGFASPDEQKSHNATPHFHCKQSNSTEHTHDHSPLGHRHDHASKSQSHESGTEPADNRIGLLDHDASAIFMLAGTPTFSRSNLLELTNTWHLALFAQLPAFQCDISGNPTDSPEWHPPDEVLDESGIYLTLRNLRI